LQGCHQLWDTHERLDKARGFVVCEHDGKMQNMPRSSKTVEPRHVQFKNMSIKKYYGAKRLVMGAFAYIMIAHE
jgi:hypothetical protein